MLDKEINGLWGIFQKWKSFQFSSCEKNLAQIFYKSSIERKGGNPHGDEHLLPSNLITVGVPKQEQQKILKVFFY